MQLTDKQKADLTAAGINWQQILANLAAEAPQIIAIILAIIGKKQVQGRKKVLVACDHHACCCDALTAILKAAEIEANHLCACCEEQYG